MIIFCAISQHPFARRLTNAIEMAELKSTAARFSTELQRDTREQSA